MQNNERDETKKRTTETFHFLNEEEFKKIPPDILAEARERGIKGHKLIELNWNTGLDNPIVNMFRQGLQKIRDYIGDRNITAVIDYKFTRDKLRQETAIQLVDYGELIFDEYVDYHKNTILIEEQINGEKFTGKPDFAILNILSDAADVEYFAFHYHQDGGLFVYRIPDRAKEPLRKFGMSLIDHHEEIQAGELMRYEKMNEWERLQLEYDVFEPFFEANPPAEITTQELATRAVLKYCTDVKVFEARVKQFKREIKRYMIETGVTKLWDSTGGGVMLQEKNLKKHDKAKLKAYKATIETGTEKSISLVRFNPPVPKQKRLT